MNYTQVLSVFIVTSCVPQKSITTLTNSLPGPSQKLFSESSSLALTLRLPWGQLNSLYLEESAANKCSVDLEKLEKIPDSQKPSGYAKTLAELRACLTDPPKQNYVASLVPAGGTELPVNLKARGHNSLSDCEYKKMKAKFADNAPRNSTVFVDTNDFKIGTHCLDAGRSGMYRMGGGHIAWRQVVLFELWESLGLPGIKVRRAEISYQDTSPVDPAGKYKVYQPKTEKAFLLESGKGIGSRLGGKSLDEDEIAALTKVQSRVDPLLLMKNLLFQTLIDNVDFTLALRPWMPARNFEMVLIPKTPEGFDLLMMPNDVDLASAVNGALGDKDAGTYGENAPLVSGTYGLRAAKVSVGIADFVRGDYVPKSYFDKYFPNAVQFFMEHKSEILQFVAKAKFAEGDEDGRKILQEHVDGFYIALENRDKIVSYIRENK